MDEPWGAMDKPPHTLIKEYHNPKKVTCSKPVNIEKQQQPVQLLSFLNSKSDKKQVTHVPLKFYNFIKNEKETVKISF
jgi:hypothetical protein